jgi:hypothetical protein
LKILLFSDTHSYIDEALLNHVKDADEVWHAGDIGKIEVADKIKALKPLRAVHGNIDDHIVRVSYPEDLFFVCEGLKVMITHIGGSPGKYIPRVRTLIDEHHPELFICGHSHLLKVMRDPKKNMLYMNPGAAGVHGFHKVRTMLRFKIEQGKILELDVIELGLRGALPQSVG